MELEARKAVLYSIFDAGVRAVAPDAALMRHVCLEGDSLLVDGKRWPLPRRGRLLVLGAGKGVAPMGAAVEELLGDRIHSGLLVVKYGHGLPLRQITQVEAAHPVPDAAGAAATQALLELAAGTTADDLVLCLLTGGASALTPAPVPGVTLEDMQQVTELLLHRLGVLLRLGGLTLLALLGLGTAAAVIIVISRLVLGIIRLRLVLRGGGGSLGLGFFLGSGLGVDRLDLHLMLLRQMLEDQVDLVRGQHLRRLLAPVLIGTQNGQNVLRRKAEVLCHIGYLVLVHCSSQIIAPPCVVISAYCLS